MAVHSCGPWSHTMPLLANYEQIYMFDCAIDKCGDPCPNAAEDVGQAVAGKELIAKVRIGEVDDDTEERLKALVNSGTKLVVEIAYQPEKQKDNYQRVTEILNNLY